MEAPVASPLLGCGLDGSHETLRNSSLASQGIKGHTMRVAQETQVSQSTWLINSYALGIHVRRTRKTRGCRKNEPRGSFFIPGQKGWVIENKSFYF